MMREIGVQVKWLQHKGSQYEHFDISKGKRAIAIERGAVEITRRQVGLLLRARREVASDLDREHGPRSGSFLVLQKSGTEQGSFLP